MVIASALAIGRASAQPVEASEARALFEEGVALSDRGDYESAVDRFQRSLALVERPSTLFNLGVALRELRRDEEAIAALERFLEIADASFDEVPRTQARAWIESMRRALAERGGTLVLEIDPPDAHVRVDGFDVTGESPIVLDVASGTHRVEVSADGVGSETFDVVLAAGGRETRRVALGPRSSPGLDLGEPHRLAAIVTTSAAAVVLGGAIAATVVREDQVARYHGESCAPTTWGTRRDACPELRADIDVSTGAAIATWTTAGVLAGTAVILWLLAPAVSSEAPPVAALCAPSFSTSEITITCAGRL
ncbi:hypothetical protein DB32_001835 [Sandaracinus amylolyticus]|uniref:PEGA domain-containing protein n=1 Tax=Sandaracinus amylolyticus TaxID=927083 RepID=A0A0F6W109_9BACT|nr:hypothetical protein DB32_001835 [Sandaracinus amylolyticus]